MSKTKLTELDPFLCGYLTAAFFTNDDDAPSGEYTNTDRPDAMMEKLSPEALELAKKDCAQFTVIAAHYLCDAGDPSQNGHDFWLTRNGHGAGFWDRGYHDATAEILSKESESFGETDLYEGDDGQLYFSR